jgi:predicted membrane GTPase involved in stress response
MLVTNLDYDEHKGRISIGRISKGRVVKGDQVVLAKPGVQLLYPLVSACSKGVCGGSGASWVL